MNVGQMAVGARAEAHAEMALVGETFAHRGLQEVCARLEALLKHLEDVRDDKKQAELFGAATVLMGELKKSEPNKLTISSIVQGMADGLKSTASALTALNGLKDAISIFF
jgi:hypothetical protein